jgi:hypothetical protein
MRRIGAETKTRFIQEKIAEYSAVKYVRDPSKNAEIALVNQQDDAKIIIDYCKAIQTEYRDYDGTAASLFCIGTLQLRYAEFLNEFPLDDLSDEAVIIFEEQLSDIITPYEENGRATLENVIELAKKSENWSSWTSASVNELARHYPDDYPPEKDEVRGTSHSENIPSLGPKSVKVDGKEVPLPEPPSLPSEDVAPAPSPEGEGEAPAPNPEGEGETPAPNPDGETPAPNPDGEAPAPSPEGEGEAPAPSPEGEGEAPTNETTPDETSPAPEEGDSEPSPNPENNEEGGG